MPVEMEIDEARQLTIAKYIDPWTLDDYFASFGDVMTRDRLANLSEAGSLDWVNIDVLRKIGAHSRQFDHLRPGGRTAFVVPTRFVQSLIKLFRALAETEQQRDISVRIFTNVDDAMDWLRSDRDD